MIRFVMGPGAIVVPDIGRKLPGRGVWVTARADRVAEAVKRQAFSRGFKTKAVASESLAAEIEALLTKDCLQALSMANKAGSSSPALPKWNRLLPRGPLLASFMRRIVVLTECANSGKTCAGAMAVTKQHARKTVFVRPIGFGFGTDKCDTCSSDRRIGS